MAWVWPIADSTFPFRSASPDATRQGDGAVVGEHVAVERVQRGVVDVRREHALAQVVEDHDPDGAPEPPEALLVQLGPAPRAGLEGQQPDALAAVAQGEHEQPRAAVLPRDRVAHHGPVAVVDLPFLPGRGHDHRVRLGGALAAELPDEAADAGVPPREAVVIDQVLPDRHGIAPPGERRARSARGRARRRWPWGLGSWAAARRAGSRGRPEGRQVGGHLTGRFWRRRRAPAGRRTAIPAAFRYALAVSRRTPVAASMRRSVQPSRPNARTCCSCRRPRCWSCRRGDHSLPAASTSWGAATSLAGFQVSTTGRYVEGRITVEHERQEGGETAVGAGPLHIIRGWRGSSGARHRP